LKITSQRLLTKIPNWKRPVRLMMSRISHGKKGFVMSKMTPEVSPTSMHD
jgi:hypothetical protein